MICPDCGGAMLTERPHRHALDCDGKPFCPSGYAQRYHAIGQCACPVPEAVAAERERIRAAVEGLEVIPLAYRVGVMYADLDAIDRAAVLAIVNPEVKK